MVKCAKAQFSKERLILACEIPDCNHFFCKNSAKRKHFIPRWRKCPLCGKLVKKRWEQVQSMNWETYYEKFYDWAESTQIRKLSELSDFGPPEEIVEVIEGLMNEKAASRLARKAVEAGVQFSTEQLAELTSCCDTPTMNQLLLAAKQLFDQETLEDEFYGAVDDAVLAQVAARNRVKLFAYDEDEEDPEGDDYDPIAEEPEPKLGFFGKLAIVWGSCKVFNWLLGRDKDR